MNIATVTLKEYFAVTGSRFSQKDAEIIGPELERISQKYEGIDAKAVVCEAKNGESPLHNYFEWDDKEAAEKYREDQARAILRSIKVKIVTPNNEEVKTRAFLPVTIYGEERKYKPIEQIMMDRQLVDQITEEAYRELVGWKNRYETYRKLYPVFNHQMSVVFDAIEVLG